MRKIVGVLTGLLVVVLVSGAGAQTQPMAPSQPSQSPSSGSSEAPGPQSHAPMMGPGMMGHEMMGGMMCPMMGRHMMGMGMGRGMMGGMTGASDPKTMARMLKLRGDMLKAIGEVMLKHAQELEQGK
jgi:hypothetical protein